MHAVGLAQRRRRLEERRLRAPQTVQQQQIRPLAHGQRRDLELADGHVMDAQQRRAAVGKPEQAFEADREIEVAAGIQPPLRERLDA
jgi:hypothetical protein